MRHTFDAGFTASVMRWKPGGASVRKTDSSLHGAHHRSAAQCSRMVSPHQHQSIISTSCCDRKVHCSSQLSNSFGSSWSHEHYTRSGCESLKHDYLHLISLLICQVVLVWCTKSHFISIGHATLSPHLWQIVRGYFFSFFPRLQVLITLLWLVQ